MIKEHEREHEGGWCCTYLDLMATRSLCIQLLNTWRSVCDVIRTESRPIFQRAVSDRGEKSCHHSALFNACQVQCAASLKSTLVRAW